MVAPRSRFEPDRALAVYGTLAPGGSNHHVVAGLGGRWLDGVIRGHRFEARWRGHTGYPGFRPDPAGPAVPVRVLVSDRLADHWERLDDFEGPGYRRVVIDVLGRGEADGPEPIGRAWVYECLAGPGGAA